jgi:hypothetical protein
MVVTFRGQGIQGWTRADDSIRGGLNVSRIVQDQKNAAVGKAVK